MSAVTKHPLLRCLAIYRTMPWRFGLTLTLFVIVNGSLTWYQYLVGQAVHDVERGKAVVQLDDGSFDYSVAKYWALILIGIAVARAVLQYVAGIAALHTGQELLHRLRDAILTQVQRLDLGYHLRHGVGEMVARTTRDADKVRDALISFWRQIIETGLVIAASLAILAWYHPLLAVVPAALALFGIYLFTRQADTLVVLDRAVGDAYDLVSQDLVEGVGGVRVIKAFSLESSRIERFDRAVAGFEKHARAAVHYSATHIPIPQIIVAFGQVWVFGYGILLVAHRQLNIGELVAATLAMNTLVFRFEGIGRVIQIFADARSSAGRIMDFLDTEPRITSGTALLPRGPLGFALRAVTVSTNDDQSTAILRDLELEVKPGETVALVGATGSGKSTIAALLPRLLDPSKGNVVFASNHGASVNVKDVSLEALRRHVHVATQDCFLFSDTVAANLRVVNPQASEADLRRALRLAAVEDVIDALPEGLETRIGDRGLTLSGGQRQRLALARAFLSKPSVLVLDDSTSALDAVTEQTILNGISELSSNNTRPTLLLVTSKPSTVLFADRVLVLEHGKITQQGTHAELSRSSATYRDLLGLDDEPQN